MVKGAAVISAAPTTIPSMLSFFMIGLHDNPARQRDAFSHCSFLGDQSKSGIQFRSGSSVTRAAVSPATGKMVGINDTGALRRSKVGESVGQRSIAAPARLRIDPNCSA
jgi:hypothetical protein